MSQNPFDALGGGSGFDMNALLEQAQQMQAKLEEAQQRLADAVVEGAAGGVTVRVSGTGDLLGVEITLGSFDGGNPEDLADLGDLVVAAYRDAKVMADQMASDALGPLAGGGAGGDLPGQLGFS